MRKIVSHFFISLDGVVESPDQWHFPYFSDEMGEAIGAGFAASDALLLGRRNYEEWASYWPTSEDEFAPIMNGMQKYVVSSTLESTDWSNSILIKDDVAATIAKLKTESGKNIAMSGSGRLVEWLLQNDLLDELQLLVHPLVVGKGRRLFQDAQPTRELELIDSKTFSTGVLHLTYKPRGS